MITNSDDEEALEVRQEMEPIFRSAQILHFSPKPQIQPQSKTELVQKFLPIAPWTPYCLNQYMSDYPEERIFIEDSATVAFRVSDCNMIRSIEAEYNNELATVEYIVPQNTHFRIMLFHGKIERYIIVDICKMSSCSLVFQEEYRAIMNAAKFGEISRRKVLQCIKAPALGV